MKRISRWARLLLCAALVLALLPPIAYTADESYEVVWRNYDGTVLETDTDVANGTTPSFDAALPERAPEGSTYYTFAGWTPGLGAISKDMTYTATFKATDR